MLTEKSGERRGISVVGYFEMAGSGRKWRAVAGCGIIGVCQSVLASGQKM